MALTERFENDKIEIVGPWKILQIRRAEIIEKDGVEITRVYKRRVLKPGDPYTSEDADVKAICKALWTTAHKKKYKAFIEAQNASLETPVTED